MRRYIFTLLLLSLELFASERLVFGAISTVEPELMQQHLSPAMKYIEKVTGKKVVFQTGYDYDDTIEKFAKGQFDIGYIGPVPYIKAKRIDPESLNILARLKNAQSKPFQSVIITRKNSTLNTLEDIDQHTFAFGSPQSTLSYYVPMDMLIRTGSISRLQSYNFLGRHDKVAQYVIMGKYDLGAVKNSVAQVYSKYIKVVQKSAALPDFLMVSSSKLDKDTSKKIQDALLSLENKDILKAFKSSAVGFESAKDSDYNELRDVVKRVEEYVKSR
jgi:phosphonate transport system substrate-binding protein